MLQNYGSYQLVLKDGSNGLQRFGISFGFFFTLFCFVLFYPLVIQVLIKLLRTSRGQLGKTSALKQWFSTALRSPIHTPTMTINHHTLQSSRYYFLHGKPWSKIIERTTSDEFSNSHSYILRRPLLTHQVTKPFLTTREDTQCLFP